ncbi:deoxynucleoside triphosphate triphosphohydrolase SAMHD1-like isoform X2 [Panulirus ornatus]
MFHARRVLHRTAYQHRVAKTIELMLVDAFLYADKHIRYRGKDGIKYALGDVCDDMSAFTNLTDEVFHHVLLAEGEHRDLLRAKEILKNILKRQLYVFIGHTQPTADDIIKDTLVEALSRNIPARSPLSIDKLGIQEVRITYGMGDKNPIECVRFFSKTSPDVAKVIRKEEVSIMLPQSFQEVLFRLVCKSYDGQSYNDAQKTFRAACKELNMKEPSVDSWPSILNPVNCNQHHTNGSAPAGSPAV